MELVLWRSYAYVRVYVLLYIYIYIYGYVERNKIRYVHQAKYKVNIVKCEKEDDAAQHTEVITPSPAV